MIVITLPGSVSEQEASAASGCPEGMTFRSSIASGMSTLPRPVRASTNDGAQTQTVEFGRCPCMR